ncbi:MAG: RNA polymerase sigma factor [Verrucomicrobiota bacterium]
MDNDNAIAQCRAGNIDAFRHLVERYQTEAFGHALAILGSRADAADAVQDAFVKAFRALDGFQAGRRFYPWFYTILRHGCFKLAQARMRRSCVDDADLLLLVPAESNHPSQDVEQLEKALLRLAPQDRELITLKHLDGLSYEELARRLEIPPGTVMSR